MSYAGLLLAAGAGERIGIPKALIRLPDGQSLLTKGIRTLREGGCEDIVVVLGAAERQVRSQYEAVSSQFDSDKGSVVLISNTDYAAGMSTSVRSGLRAVHDLLTQHDAAVVLLVDTPEVTPEAVAKVGGNADPQALAVATYDGEMGHPILIGREHWRPVAQSMTGDVGARQYFKDRDDVISVQCDGLGSSKDIDTPADLEALHPRRTEPADVLRADVTNEEVSVGFLEVLVRDNRAGAVVSFSGNVRDHDHGRLVSDLHYLMHPSADQTIKKIAADCSHIEGVRALAVSHRVGHLQIGDVALACVVSAEHRQQAFEVCSLIVERVKAELAIWKRQVFQDGTDEWVNSP